MSGFSLIVEFGINNGRTADFRVAAQRLIDITNEERGTLRYDWFVREDGLRDVNLEHFTAGDDWITHDDHVAADVPALVETGALSRFSVLGEANAAVRKQLEGQDAEFYDFWNGVERRTGGTMALIGDWTIKAGQNDAFAAAAKAAIDLTGEEPGTLAYDWYLAADGQSVRVVEEFSDGAAFLAHAEHVKELLSPLRATSTMTSSLILGDPGPARGFLTRPGTDFYPFWAGIDR